MTAQIHLGEEEPLAQVTTPLLSSPQEDDSKTPDHERVANCTLPRDEWSSDGISCSTSYQSTIEGQPSLKESEGPPPEGTPPEGTDVQGEPLATGEEHSVGVASSQKGEAPSSDLAALHHLSSASVSYDVSSSAIICRICHCESAEPEEEPRRKSVPRLSITPSSALVKQNGDSASTCGAETSAMHSSEPLISPCHCSGTLKYVHQTCLQQWIKSAQRKKCELCNYEFEMTTEIKPFRQWKKLNMTTVERRKVLCSVTFHVVAITCVVWSLYVLINRTREEVLEGKLQWPFWTKLVVVAIGFTGGLVFMYVQCKMYVQLFRKWKDYNRVIYILEHELSQGEADRVSIGRLAEPRGPQLDQSCGLRPGSSQPPGTVAEGTVVMETSGGSKSSDGGSTVVLVQGSNCTGKGRGVAEIV